MAEGDARKTHIFRVFGTTPSGQDKSVWIDLERLDEIELREGAGQEFQRTFVKLVWYQDEAGEVPNPARDTDTLKIIPPDEDPDDPGVWFEVELNRMIAVLEADQRIKITFNNSDENRSREVEIKRVVHYDTPAVDDAYPDGGKIPRAAYERDKGSKDTSQYLDAEFIVRRHFEGYTVSPVAGGRGGFDHQQRWRIAYNNEALIALMEEPDRAYGDGEINPPWRLDPLQNIVNVNFAAQVIVAIVSRADELDVEVIDDKAELIGAAFVRDDSAQKAFYIKVSAALGETFLRTTIRDLTPANLFVLPWQGSDVAANIERARAALEFYLFDETDASWTPPGMLWQAHIFQWPASGAVAEWKIGSVNHRRDDAAPSDLPNKMVQCYPLGVDPNSYSTEIGELTILGFNIPFYRLDRKGEGPAYDPMREWRGRPIQVASGSDTPNRGCLFADPLPLGSRDEPYSSFEVRGKGSNADE